RRLGRVDGTGGYEAAPQTGRFGDGGVGPHHDDGGQVTVAVPHGQGRDADPGGLAEPAGPDPGQWRVPGGVDAAGQEVLDLPFVVGVQDVVEVEVVAG